jgi:hypothetical protein
MIIIATGRTKKETQHLLDWIEEKHGCKGYLGIGLTVEWDTEYTMVFPNMDIHIGIAYGHRLKQEAILFDQGGHGKIVYMDCDKQSESIGHAEIKRRKGDMELLFNKNIGKELLKQEDVENLTAFKVNIKHGYSTIVYR